MNIEWNKTEGNLNIALDGRLDTTTAPELEKLLAENYDGKGTLTFDFAKLSYISSAGLRVLLGAQKKAKNAMKLVNVPKISTRLFSLLTMHTATFVGNSKSTWVSRCRIMWHRLNFLLPVPYCLILPTASN